MNNVSYEHNVIAITKNFCKNNMRQGHDDDVYNDYWLWI